MLPLCVVNNYGQFNHLILRALRDLDIEAKLIPNTTPVEQVREGYMGIILGGGPDIARAGLSSQYLHLDRPVLGICLGLHVIAEEFGGKVHSGQKGGYGAVTITITDHQGILEGYPETMQVWASHADEVISLPPEFKRLATSSICGNEAIAHPEKQIFGIQWHPEVSHTFEGYRIFENFYKMCQT
ncbi:GMP synthase subunit A [Methanospirillum stamsii]|uniref:GMP synthase [glutamine-hydrolyzing] subunit A n=1 Tax=Methanospirillum stamsii TaxID=1277351 RepID=A0A2V2MRK4_9EURY|nr:GMP synthase subunit A [Methanospirillum stamsii]PWR70762.1 GMP synthase [Methanospirillum stamsii]